MAAPPLPSLTGGAGGAASASGGGASGESVFDSAGMTVNYAPSIGVGGGLSPWLIVAGLVALWIWKRRA